VFHITLPTDTNYLIMSLLGEIRFSFSLQYVLNRLPAGKFGVRNLVQARFSTLVHIGPEAHPSHVQWVLGLFRGKAAGALCQHTTPAFFPGLKESSAISLLPIGAFMACFKVNVPFYVLY
jgi:hypothetical protein